MATVDGITTVEATASYVRVWERTTFACYRYCTNCGENATHCCHVFVNGVGILTYLCGEHATTIAGGA